MKSNKLNSLYIGLLLGSLAWALIMIVGLNIPEGAGMKRIFIMLGSEFPSGIIQLIMYMLFFFGLTEIILMSRMINKQNVGNAKGLLPDTDQYVLGPADVNQIKLKAIEANNKDKLFIYELIIQACTKFRSAKSTGETLELVSNWVRLNYQEADAKQSLIRYAAWAIPSVGFIGTIIGIATSLGLANEVSGAEGISKVTAALNIAFDTTLIALLLSLILMFYYHQLSEHVDQFYTEAERYVIENLINRIYKS